jgi:hypothetical protein
LDQFAVFVIGEEGAFEGLAGLAGIEVFQGAGEVARVIAVDGDIV